VREEGEEGEKGEETERDVPKGRVDLLWPAPTTGQSDEYPKK
jgi:hypothetical protein